MKKPVISVVMGSKSDLDLVKNCAGLLKEFGVEYELRVLSAHRSPEATVSFVRKASQRKIKVIIAFAGGAAHLAGVIASHTVLPVIGVPVKTTVLKGIDSYLSTLQMPSGVPVATMPIGKAGAKNAAILAVQILGISDAGLRKKITQYKKKLARKVLTDGLSLKS